MTWRHRRVHVLMWIVLGPLMLIGLAVAISIRPAAGGAADVSSERHGGSR